MTAVSLCPRCEGQKLAEQTVGDGATTVAAHGCAVCGGLWLSPQALESVTKTVQAVFIEIRHIPSRRLQLIDLQCPDCSVRMAKIRHERDAKVVIDICPACKGVWLDKGELEAIREEGLFTCLMNTLRFVNQG
jgi:uncharacterized protein